MTRILLFTAISLALPLTGFANRPPHMGPKPGGVSASLSANYEGLSASTKGSGNSKYSYGSSEFSIRYQASDKHTYGSAIQYSVRRFDPPVAHNARFWSNRASLSYGRKLSERSSYRIAGGVDSSADRVLSQGEDLNYFLNFNYLRRSRGRNFWIYGAILSYSPNGTSFPLIPYAVYYYHYSDLWQFQLGAPVSISLTPSKALAFRASYRFPNTASVRGDYKLSALHSLFLDYSISDPKSYRETNRTEREQHLFYNESKYSLGWHMGLPRRGAFELAGVYAYNRDIWRGKKVTRVNEKSGFPNEWRVLASTTLMLF